MTIPLPVLTFPQEVAAFVQATFASANTILEYGSGGSTFAAASQRDKRIFSVESDPVWANRMQQIAAAHDLPSPPTILYFNIGPVGKWARAINHLRLSDFVGYAQAVWDRPDFVHPDVVLIDGRFRAACFMAAYLNTKRPIRVLIDDYTGRPRYHVIERLCKPAQLVGRMAVFDFCPEDRLKIQPWCLVATFFDAASSFQIGAGRLKFKTRVRRAILRSMRGIVFGSDHVR